MNNVLVFGITDNSGGMESVIMNYYRNLDHSKYKFTFVVKQIKTVAYMNEIINNGDKIIHIGSRMRHPVKFYRDLNNIFKNSQFDILWFNVCHLVNIELIKYAFKFNVKKIIVHAHNSKMMDKGIKKIPMLILHYWHKLSVSRYATDFWSCDKEASNFMFTRSDIDSKKHKIVSNAIDVTKFKFNKIDRKKYRKKLNLEGYYVLGNVGRLHFQKNQKFIIKLCYELNKTEPTKLLLVGAGPDYQKLKALAEKLKIQDKVLFLGNRSDIPSLLSAMDVFVLPSLFEGLSVSCIEAQTSGLPVFASNTISRNTCISNNFWFLKLDNYHVWAKSILIHKNDEIDRIVSFNLISKGKYNIQHQHIFNETD